MIDEGIFVEIGICEWEGKVMATGSKRRSSADATTYVAVEEGNVGSGLCWIYDRTIVCQQ